MGRDLDSASDIVCDDRVLMTLQYSTQWDTLAHVSAHFDANGDDINEPVYYNGYRANDDLRGPVAYENGGAARSAHIRAPGRWALKTWWQRRSKAVACWSTCTAI